MLYFLALFLPPLAVAWCAGAGAFFLNVILTLCGVVPGIVHALFVVNRFHSDRRHEQLISAITGKNFTAPRIAGAGLVALAVVAVAVAFTVRAVNDLAEKGAAVKRPAALQASDSYARQLPVIDGWTISEVESTHGKAERKDKTTGWAVWPAFKAHFANGAVDRVEALELR